jgi:FHS family Na+ dependent glucose MFS transporter 1
MKQLAVSTGSTLAVVTTFVAIKSLGYMLGSFTGARLYDRYKGHTIMIISISAMTALMLVIPFTGSFLAAVIPMFLLGFAEGTTDIGGNLMIMWVFRENLAPYMNALHFMFGIGSLLAPIITANFMTYENSLQLTYWVMALLFLPSIIGFTLLPSPDRIESPKIREGGQQQKLVIMFFALLFFTYVGTEITFGNWIFTYASESKLVTDIQAAYLNSVFWGSFTIGRLIGIFISKKIRPRPMLLINFTGSVLSLGLMMIFQNSPAILWITSALLGLFMATTYPTLMVYAQSLFTITGSITSWFMIGSGMGVLIIPFIMTFLFDKLGIQVVPTVLFLVITVGFLILIVTLASAKKITKKIQA